MERTMAEQVWVRREVHIIEGIHTAAPGGPHARSCVHALKEAVMKPTQEKVPLKGTEAYADRTFTLKSPCWFKGDIIDMLILIVLIILKQEIILLVEWKWTCKCMCVLQKILM